MRKFIVLLFCSFLSAGKLEVVRNEDSTWQATNNGMLPVVEEHIWPKHAYLTYQSNQLDKNGRTIPTKPCSKPGEIEETQLKQVVPSPTRRSSASEIEKSPLTDFESTNLQYRGNQLRRTYTEQTTQSPELINDEIIQNEVQMNRQEINLTPSETLLDENYESNPQINVIPLDRDIEAPVSETTEPESYTRQVSRNQLTTSSPITAESTIRHTDAQCSDKQKANTGTEPPRRFLIPAKYIPNRNSGTRTNSNLYSTNVLRSGNNNMDEQSRSQTSETNNLIGKPALGSIRTNNDDQNLDASSYKTADKPAGRSGRIHYILKGNGANNLIDPTKGNGISYVTKSTRMMLMDFDRVCYACSSANNPNCLSPDRRTPVKYCRKGDNACVVKSFGSGSTLTIVRDCGRTCDDAEIPGLVPKYKTCSMCHSDLCNGAYSINVRTLILIMPTIVSVAVIKSLF